ncbi:hypothetical protein [Tuwongella immobilis]|uniref:FtsH ternary system domain-containing protein n=1 Tax=Tuwongella immobilis TaxID=692036 RepID=A0A6C2YL13_9BACT|nr:hypothetical protein [Tuwongella immobilis]VIP01991.1 Uncultured bacterium genome assembly Metasoil_fosmids_resub OS=uncultured bacterium PE=4 SV=1 [Tuwongella immobilis]VTS00060.1 Uncultured bacterium genome assembly Metasoil_fosmids_resub OS=uncultured bacterium PE=4 SV=1 [Tuwongella immobilis]
MSSTAIDNPSEPPTSGGPPTVSRFEANLLRILRFFLGVTPFEQAHPLILQSQPRPNCLSRSSIRLIEDSLRKGIVRWLTQAGAWRRDRFLRMGAPSFGRLWERTPPEKLGLVFTKQSLSFLIWMTANKPAAGKAFWQPAADTGLTIGDELLLFLGFAAMRQDAEMMPVLRAPDSPFSRNALCWLAFPDDFATNSPEAVPSFANWMVGDAALVMEAMQHYWMNRWLHIEREKGQIVDWDHMRLTGQVQERVLERLLQDAESAQRPDLVRFLLQVAAQVLSAEEISPIFWTGALTSTRAPARLVDRLATQRSALSLLRAIDNLQQWERRARLVGYFDDGFAASQLFLSDWESANGSVLNRRGQRIIQQFDPLRAPTASPPTPPSASAPDRGTAP